MSEYDKTTFALWWQTFDDRSMDSEQRMDAAWQAACAYKDKRIVELKAGMKTISKIKELKGDPYLTLNLVIDIANKLISEEDADE